MSESPETSSFRRTTTAFHYAERRARARGLTDDDIEREQEDDDSQFWVDVWTIAHDLDRFADHKARFLKHKH